MFVFIIFNMNGQELDFMVCTVMHNTINDCFVLFMSRLLNLKGFIMQNCIFNFEQS